jgi:glycosyltransferase involved in cell wall biosynthesis
LKKIDRENSKVLVGIIHKLEMGGAERMMVNILNHFAKEGKEVHLIVFHYIGSLKEQLNSNIIIHDLEVTSVKNGLLKLFKTLYSIKPDTIFSGIGHLNIALAPFIPLLKVFLPKSRWVSRETNIASMKNKKSKYPKLFDFLYRKLYQNYDVIIAQSQDMRDDLLLHYPKAAKKAVIINNPIDIERVTALSCEGEVPKINLINVSRFRQAKRHHLMLEVLAKLPKHYYLTLVGSGTEEENLKSLVKCLSLDGRVDFAGHQSNPYPYMKQADLFLLTSEHEGFPNVLLEANALGLPVVAFACPGGITEIIEEGLNGFSVTNGEVDEMVLTIQKSMDYAFDKEKIISLTKDRYSQDIIAQKYREVFYGER